MSARGAAIVRRVATSIGGALITIFISMFVVFAGLATAPGDPVNLILGRDAPPEQRAQLREILGLNEPLVLRFFHWLWSALQGDFGRSIIRKQEVTDLIVARASTSALLIAMAALLIIVLGIGLGILGGISPKWRSPVSALVGLGIAIPNFVAAGFLVIIFSVTLGWFPTYGAGDGFGDRIWHLTLPAIALAISSAAYVAQLSAAAIAQESDREFVYTSLGRGVPQSRIIRVHVMRNSALPVLTASGIAVAGLVAGTVIVEKAFAVSGLGQLLVESVMAKDYPVVQAISLVVVVAFVAIMTMIDLLQIAMDPRVRGGS